MGKGVKDQGGHSIHDNLIFYVDIARYDKKEYINQVVAVSSDKFMLDGVDLILHNDYKE